MSLLPHYVREGEIIPDDRPWDVPGGRHQERICGEAPCKRAMERAGYRSVNSTGDIRTEAKRGLKRALSCRHVYD